MRPISGPLWVLIVMKRDAYGVSEVEAILALHEVDQLWSQLFPAVQARIIQLLMRHVTVIAAGLEDDIRREASAVSPHDLYSLAGKDWDQQIRTAFGLIK